MNFDWLQDKRLRFVAQTLPSLLYFVSILVTLASQLGYLAVVIAVAGAVVLLFVANHIVEKAAPEPNVGFTPKPPSETRKIQSETFHPVCDTGPHKVSGGEFRTIPLNIMKGQRLRGHLAEMENQPFDWFISDEKNLVKFKNRQTYTPIGEGHDDPAYRIDRRIPRQARWYLVLDMRGRQNYREVRVDFEHIPQSLAISESQDN